MFLIWHLTSCNHVFKGLYDFMGGSPSQSVTTLLGLVAFGKNGDKMYSICCVTSQDQVIEGS